MQKFIFLSENTPLNTHASKLQVFRQTILRTGISRLIHFVATLSLLVEKKNIIFFYLDSETMHKSNGRTPALRARKKRATGEKSCYFL